MIIANRDEITLDTLVVVGGAAETNPLLIYKDVFPTLLDDTLIAYSENSIKGRIVVVNPFSGRGWEVIANGDGPGEFGQSIPMLYPYDGVIHAVTPMQRYSRWSYDGKLLESHIFHDPWFEGPIEAFPMGVVGGRVALRYSGRPFGVEPQTLPQGIWLEDPKLGRVADVTEGIPSVRTNPEQLPNGSVTYHEGGGFTLAARGELLVRTMINQPMQLMALDASGKLVAQRQSSDTIVGLFIDADQRVWVNTSTRADGADNAPRWIYQVLDSQLRPLCRLAAPQLWDAHGETLLTIDFDEDLETLELMLLHMRKGSAGAPVCSDAVPGPSPDTPRSADTHAPSP